MSIADRLRNLLTTKGWSEGELSRQSGVTQPTINRILSGESSSPRMTNITKLAHALRVKPEWLLLGGAVANNVVPIIQPYREEGRYPLISWIAAGEMAESPDNFEPGDGSEWLTSNENAGHHGYWLEVKGRSMMSPTDGHSFVPGMRILVQPEGFDVISGKLYIAKIMSTGETTFKRYIRDAGVEYLEPLNPQFETIKIDNNVSIIGRVIDAKLPPSAF
jgi:SOS-response transcriptional repressor LexA